MPDLHDDHPLTVLEKVPEWVHDAMTDIGYDLMPCSWANALYEWHSSSLEGTPPHTVEMFFFDGGRQVRLLATVEGGAYENAFCKDDDTDLLQGKIATLRQRLRARHA
jgi:hypothetical protein